MKNICIHIVHDDKNNLIDIRIIFVKLMCDS